MRRWAGILAAAILLTACSRGSAGPGAGPGPAPGLPQDPLAAVVAIRESVRDQQGQADHLAAQVKQAGTPIVVGDRLLFVYQGHHGENISVVGGVDLDLSEVGQTGLFTGDVQVPAVDKAIISYTISVTGKPQRDPWTKWPAMAEGSPVAVFRGASAPNPPEVNLNPAVAHGKVAERTFTSKAIGEDRRVWVYLPPGFSAEAHYPVILAADGQMYFDGTINLAWTIDSLLAEHKMPPVAVVGVESHLDERVQDFIFQQAQFDAYQTFLRHELLPWVTQEFKLQPEAGDLVPLGLSNGGAWALYTSMIEPNQFRGGILQSALTPETALPPLPSGNRYYISAGTLDPAACSLQDELATMLEKAGNRVQTDRGVGGHDAALFETQLVQALTWMFAN